MTSRARGYIQIKSFNCGVENPATIGSATGGAGAGKAKFNQLTVDKDVDSTTPQVFQRLARASTSPASRSSPARRRSPRRRPTPPATTSRWPTPSPRSRVAIRATICPRRS